MKEGKWTFLLMPFLMWEWNQTEDFSENGNKPVMWSVESLLLIASHDSSCMPLLQSLVNLGDFFANYWLQ